MGMDSKKLSARTKQPGHDRTFTTSETNFSEALRSFLDPKLYQVTDKPRDLARIFPRAVGDGLGVHPEASITSLTTGKKLFFEVKKQGPNGNADERACKHHTVQFQAHLKSVLGYSYHSFFTVFCESLATDERYLVKHPYFYEPDHYFCWVDYDRDALRVWIEMLCARFLT